MIALIAENAGHVKAVAEMTKEDLDPMMGRAIATDRPYLTRRAERFVGHEAVLDEPIRDGYGRVALGDTADVTFDAFPGRRFAASVSEIGADADPRTGTFQIKLRLTVTDAPLKSGLVGRAAIRPAVQPGVNLAIPVDAILEGHGHEAVVFKVDPASGAAKRVRISTGRISGGLVAVTAGLTAGDQVVIDGAGYLTDGEKIAIATASAE